MTAHTPDWHHQAACRTADPELFFPGPQDNIAAAHAKTICATCPVTTQCLQLALDNHERHGIWGGLAPGERARLLADQQRPPRIAQCGTPAGYKQHRRLDEPACRPCKDALAQYQQQRRVHDTPRRKTA